MPVTGDQHDIQRVKRSPEKLSSSVTARRRVSPLSRELEISRVTAECNDNNGARRGADIIGSAIIPGEKLRLRL